MFVLISTVRKYVALLFIHSRNELFIVHAWNKSRNQIFAAAMAGNVIIVCRRTSQYEHGYYYINTYMKIVCSARDKTIESFCNFGEKFSDKNALLLALSNIICKGGCSRSKRIIILARTTSGALKGQRWSTIKFKFKLKLQMANVSDLIKRFYYPYCI